MPLYGIKNNWCTAAPLQLFYVAKVCAESQWLRTAWMRDTRRIKRDHLIRHRENSRDGRLTTAPATDLPHAFEPVILQFVHNEISMRRNAQVTPWTGFHLFRSLDLYQSTFNHCQAYLNPTLSHTLLVRVHINPHF